MSDRDCFWEDPGCAPGMSRQETEAFLYRLGTAYREQGNAAFADALLADARRKIAAPRPGPDEDHIRAWECARGVKLPGALRAALQAQDGGYVRGTPLRISRLSEMAPLSEAGWDHLGEYEENRKFGDPSKLIQIGSEEIAGGILILDYNIGPEPRIVWLRRDLGDELRDERDPTLEGLLQRLREMAGAYPPDQRGKRAIGGV